MAFSIPKFKLPPQLGFLAEKPFLVTLGSIVGFFLLVNYAAMPLYVNHGGTLTVPGVVGLKLDDARLQLERGGLIVVEAETRPDPVYPPGTVVQQNPAAQSEVKAGRRVYLTLSGGEIKVHVPSLRGRSLRDARFALERFGLQLGSVGYDTSDTFPENTIIEQSVAADVKVTRGTSVNIVVSQGHVLHDAVVPNLVGRTLLEAERLLQEAGLRKGNITYQVSFDLVPNTIVDQFPRAGESLPGRSPVDLFVVKAGKPTEEIQVPENE